MWRALANCESSDGRDSATGKYHGFFQFDLDSWRRAGGPAGDPHTFSYEVQRQVAQAWQAKVGWGAWPTCARKLGLL